MWKPYQSNTLKISIEAQKINGRVKFSQLTQMCNFDPLIWFETA